MCFDTLNSLLFLLLLCLFSTSVSSQFESQLHYYFPMCSNSYQFLTHRYATPTLLYATFVTLISITMSYLEQHVPLIKQDLPCFISIQGTWQEALFCWVLILCHYSFHYHWQPSLVTSMQYQGQPFFSAHVFDFIEFCFIF